MRDRILGTAMRLFLEEGFERVTIRAIARKIDYSPAAIYLYFKDKNEILYTLAAMGFEKLNGYQQSLRTIRDPFDRLRQHGRIYLAFALKNPEFYDLMFLMRIPEKQIEEKKNWETGMRSYELLRQDVQECIRTGRLMKTDEDVATFSFWSAVHGIAALIIRDRAVMIPKKQLTASAEEAVDYLLDNMSGRKR